MTGVDIALIEREMLLTIAKANINQANIGIMTQTATMTSAWLKRRHGDAQTLTGLAPRASGTIDMLTAATKTLFEKRFIATRTELKARVDHAKLRRSIIEIGTGLAAGRE